MILNDLQFLVTKKQENKKALQMNAKPFLKSEKIYVIEEWEVRPNLACAKFGYRLFFVNIHKVAVSRQGCHCAGAGFEIFVFAGIQVKSADVGFVGFHHEDIINPVFEG